MFADEGFDGFVSKPIETEELERVLRKVLPKSAIAFVKNEEEYENFINNQTVEEPEAEGENPVSFRETLELAGVDIETGLHYCAGDMDFYKTLLAQISSEAGDKISSLRRDYSSKDWKDYEILIHATKSTCKTIGALTVSQEALNLEQAAKNKNIDYIENNHERVMSMYEDLIRAVNEAMSTEVPSQNNNEEDDADDDEVFEFSPDEEV